MTDAPEHVLVLDEGTTSTRAIAFHRGDLEAVAALRQAPLAAEYPDDGWVQQDAEEIWRRTLEVARGAIEDLGGPGAVAGIGITNQRETTVVWERATGRAIHPAIVWQDRRTEKRCDALAGHAGRIRELTGLEVDPYFSGTKAAWILDRVEGARARADAGELLFGTVDTWLTWRLTNGAVHATDATNASRTMLRALDAPAGAAWSDELCELLGVPARMLPSVAPSAHEYGRTAPEHLGAPLPILSMIGDQQSALVGHGCLARGRAKITFGTGAFLVANAGEEPATSEHRLLGTVAYDLGERGRAYALEGAIFNAGTVVQWLRDDLGVLASAAESEEVARSVPDAGGVVFVPAFTGLGAPHWDADARGAILGITRATKRAHVVRAALESLCFRTAELIEAMAADGAPVEELRVDGGMAQNDWFLQRLADVTGAPILRPASVEMTAVGAAALAAIQLGWTTPEAWASRDAGADRFDPAVEAAELARDRARWDDAVRRLLSRD